MNQRNRAKNKRLCNKEPGFLFHFISMLTYASARVAFCSSPGFFASVIPDLEEERYFLTENSTIRNFFISKWKKEITTCNRNARSLYGIEKVKSWESAYSHMVKI